MPPVRPTASGQRLPYRATFRKKCTFHRKVSNLKLTPLRSGANTGRHAATHPSSPRECLRDILPLACAVCPFRSKGLVRRGKRNQDSEASVFLHIPRHSDEFPRDKGATGDHVDEAIWIRLPVFLPKCPTGSLRPLLMASPHLSDARVDTSTLQILAVTSLAAGMGSGADWCRSVQLPLNGRLPTAGWCMIRLRANETKINWLKRDVLLHGIVAGILLPPTFRSPSRFGQGARKQNPLVEESQITRNVACQYPRKGQGPRSAHEGDLCRTAGVRLKAITRPTTYEGGAATLTKIAPRSTSSGGGTPSFADLVCPCYGLPHPGGDHRTAQRFAKSAHFAVRFETQSLLLCTPERPQDDTPRPLQLLPSESLLDCLPRALAVRVFRSDCVLCRHKQNEDSEASVFLRIPGHSDEFPRNKGAYWSSRAFAYLDPFVVTPFPNRSKGRRASGYPVSKRLRVLPTVDTSTSRTLTIISPLRRRRWAPILVRLVQLPLNSRMPTAEWRRMRLRANGMKINWLKRDVLPHGIVAGKLLPPTFFPPSRFGQRARKQTTPAEESRFTRQSTGRRLSKGTEQEGNLKGTSVAVEKLT